MFNVGGAEIVVVLLVALIVLGPDQLPKAMRTFGNVMSEVRKVSNGFQDEMRSVMNTFEDDGTKQGRTKKGEKPHSIKPPSGHPSEQLSGSDVVGRSETVPDETAPSNTEMTEVTASNPGTGPVASAPSANGDGGGTVSDAADRAAG